jgi:hypothetical protein
MSQPVGQPASGSKIPSSISVGLILITVISLALVGYIAMNPHVTTLTQQQFVTNTQNVYSTQTQTVMSYGTETVTSYGTVTALTTATSTANLGYGFGNYYGNNGNYYYQNCGYYACNYSNPGYSNYNVCQSTGGNSMVQCSGWLYQSPNGCVVLAIPIDNAYWAESRVYQYYTLQKLPSSYQPTWTWITVTGQLYQGYNYASNGTSCPGNYIVVSTVTP